MTANHTVALTRAYLATLLAALDGDCDQRVHDLLCQPDDPHFGLEVAHFAIHRILDRYYDGSLEDMRDGITQELHQLAAEQEDA